MRRRSFAVLLMSGGGASCASPAPAPVLGLWVASFEQQAATLTLRLRAAAAGGDVSAVAAEVRQQQGALPAVAAQASGSWNPPRLALSWSGPDGGAWALNARLTGPETLEGTLRWPGGTIQALRLVRP